MYQIRINLKYIIVLFISFFVLFLFSCSGEYKYYRSEKVNFNNLQNEEYSLKEQKSTNKILREKIVNIAMSIKNNRNLVYNGLRFNYDCSGFVNYVYFKAGINLLNYRVKNYNNGVERIYRLGKTYFNLSKEKGLIGDIILFNNTYDYNKNGKMDDLYTHVAIVIDFDNKTKTYKFVHIASTGWKIDYMNLSMKSVYKQNGEIYNSFLRRNDTGYKNTPKEYLAANLFYCFINIIDNLK